MQSQGCRLQMDALQLWVRSEWEGWLGLLGHHSEGTELYSLAKAEWQRQLVVVFFKGVGFSDALGYSIHFGESFPCNPFLSLLIPHTWQHSGLFSLAASIPSSTHFSYWIVLFHFWTISFPSSVSFTCLVLVVESHVINAWSHVLLTGVGFRDVLHPKWTPRVAWVLPHPSCSSTEELSSSLKQTNWWQYFFISDYSLPLTWQYEQLCMIFTESILCQGGVTSKISLQEWFNKEGGLGFMELYLNSGVQ